MVLLTFLDHRELFAWFLLVSYTTDVIDGFLARRLKIESVRGAQLDSIGDMLTLIAAIIGVAWFEWDFIRENYIPIAIVLGLYFTQMIIALVKYGRVTSFHTYLAKLSALVQGVFLIWLLLVGPIYWLFYTFMVLGIIETIEETILIFMYDEWVSEVKGIYWALKDERRNQE